MKNFILITTFLISTSSFAAKKPESALSKAMGSLGAIAVGGVQEYKIKPGNDLKTSLMTLAIQEGYVEDAAEFADQWTDNENDAWEADSLNWGATDLEGGKSYVESVLADQQDYAPNKEEYKSSLKIAQKAFEQLKRLPHLQYGVVPMGAVQCGVTFPSLMVIDAKTGEALNLVMEGAGC